MLELNTLYKAGMVPTTLILGGLLYVGILLIVVIYFFIKFLKKF